MKNEPVESLDPDDVTVAALACTLGDDLLVGRQDGRVTAWDALHACR